MSPWTAGSTASRKQLREFGLMIGITVPVVFGWLLPSLKNHPPLTWPFLLGIPFLVLALLGPNLLKWPYSAWMALGHGLGWINSHIILGLVFYLVLQPLAAILRMLRYDPLRARFNPESASYREKRQHHEINLKRIF